MDNVLGFCENALPEALEEYRHIHAIDPAVARTYLQQLAGRIEQLRALEEDGHQGEYARLLAIERLHIQNRLTARQICHMRMQHAAGAPDRAVLTAAIERSEMQLRESLARTFDAAQQNQLIEINRLEAEIRQLRRFIEQREAKRELILQKQFRELTDPENLANVQQHLGSAPR